MFATATRASAVKFNIMLQRAIRTICSFAILTIILASASAQTVRFHTNVGDINVLLLPSNTPLTVANFLNYMNKGAYTNSIVHRSVTGFIWQGGGYKYDSDAVSAIDQNPAVKNEPGISNLRGTIAMAKLGSSANSATNQWFFNLADNSANLDKQNGGFTAFGRVTDSASLAVMDKIAGFPICSVNSIFTEIPLFNCQGAITENFVIILSIGIVPAISSNGVLSASGFGGAPVAAAGSYIEIYGANLAGDVSRGWATADFNNGAAPTSLEGVTVKVNGIPAFVNYVSKTQVNVQVPAGVPSSGSVPIVVSYGGQDSLAANLTLKSTAPGLLAPASFKADGLQYIVAVHAVTGGFVNKGNIPNLPTAPAAPGETLTLYGTGFGPVASGAAIAGMVAPGTAVISTPFDIRIGGQTATVSYAGLAPNLVGVYQFNVVVPSSLTTGDHAVEATLGGEPLAQKLFLYIRAN